MASLKRLGHLPVVVSRSPCLQEDGVQSCAVLDIFSASESELRSLVSGFDAIIHLAWFVDPISYLYSEKNLECLSGTIRLAKAARAEGIKHFVGVGTCLEYDSAFGYLKTSTPLAPKSLYATTKASVFKTLQELFLLSETSFAWARIFYLYGEGEDLRRLVPYIQAQLSRGKTAKISNPDQIRDYLRVEDAGLQIAVVASHLMAGVFNICSGVGISIRQLAMSTAREMGASKLLEFSNRGSRKGPGETSGDRFLVGEPSAEILAAITLLDLKEKT